MTETGDFSFDYDTNDDIKKATTIKQNVDRSNTSLFTNFHRTMENQAVITKRHRRFLQTETSQRLYNPVICIKEGDIIFFNVRAKDLQYPRYFKDSILNTNPDFDYGQFEKLQEMIVVKGIDVQTFSFVFQQKGIYVFENSSSGTITIIGVVEPAQTCTNTVNGVGASMITKESLAEVGIKSQDKMVNPDWVFIIFSFASMNIFVYGMLGLIIWMYNLAIKNKDILSGKDNAGRGNSIYYDKVNQMLEDEKDTRCCGLWKKKAPKGAENKIDNEEDLKEKRHTYAIDYPGLEKLMARFKTAQGVLHRQMKDREKRRKQRYTVMDADGNQVEIEGNEEDNLLD